MVSVNLIIPKILFITSVMFLSLGGALGFIVFATEPYYTKELTLYSYTKNSEITIALLLKPNNIYEKTTVILTPTNNTYLNLVEGININHMFKVAEGVLIGDYSLIISLSHPDGWSKNYFSITDKINSSIYRRSISINISEIIMYIENICKQISEKVTQFDIVIEVSIRGYVKTSNHSISDQLLHRVEVRIDLLINRIFVRGDLIQNARTDEKSSIQEINYFLGFPITFMRTFSLVIASAGSIEFIAYILMRIKTKNVDVIKGFEFKYRELIAESKDIIELTEDNINNVYVSSLEELVKIARLLEKPIIKTYKNNLVYYVITDKDLRYIFELRR
ncbi:MAG: hypothetical protein QXL96_01660 [Ignisphaera sp.]